MTAEIPASCPAAQPNNTALIAISVLVFIGRAPLQTKGTLPEIATAWKPEPEAPQGDPS